MEELLRLSQPKSLDLSRALFRNQNVGRQIHQRCVPAGKKPAAAFETEGEQALFRREAVIVEGVDAVRYIDVVAGESGRGLDPAGAEAQVRIAFQKREGQDLTGAIGEEVPIGSVPASGRIILHVDLWEEHRADDLGWLQSRLSRTTQSAQLSSVMEQVRECNMQL